VAKGLYRKARKAKARRVYLHIRQWESAEKKRKEKS